MSGLDARPATKRSARPRGEDVAAPRRSLVETLDGITGWLDRQRRRADMRAAFARNEVKAALRGFDARIALRIAAAALLLGGLGYGLAWLALLDRVETGQRSHVAGDLVSLDGRIAILSGDPARLGGTSGVGPDGRTVLHGDDEAVAAHFPGSDGAVVGVDASGSLTHSAINDRTRPHAWAGDIVRRWRDAVWTPWLRPVGTWLLDWTMAWVPYTIPAAARPRRIGGFSDCSQCPDMVLTRDGYVFWRDPSKSDALILTNWIASTNAVADAPVLQRQWKVCVAEEACRSVEGGAPDTPVRVARRDIGDYTGWLSKKSGRLYASDYVDCAVPDHVGYLQQCQGWQSRSTAAVPVPRPVAQGAVALMAFRVSTSDIGRPGDVRAQRDMQRNLVEALDPATPAEQPYPSAPTLYIHYGADRSDQVARSIAEVARGLSVGNVRLTVPPIDAVVTTPNRSQLRCFTLADCETAQADLLPALGTALARPVVIQNLSSRYPTTRARLNHYELWIGADAPSKSRS